MSLISLKQNGNHIFNTPEEFTVQLPTSCSASLRLCVNFFLLGRHVRRHVAQ